MTGHDDFYVGYQPDAPPTLGRWLARAVTAVLAVGLAVALLLALGQRPPEPVVFEFGTVRTLEGTLVERPWPGLLVAPRDGSADASFYLLAGPLKQGADTLVAGWDGTVAALEGTLIFRGPYSMLEMAAPPRRLAAAPAMPQLRWDDHGHAELAGEIVDGKCHLGAMNPGQGITHRACAIRCLREGLPALLALPDGRVILLRVGDAPATDAVLAWVGVPVRVAGRLARAGAWEALDLDPGSLALDTP